MPPIKRGVKRNKPQQVNTAVLYHLLIFIFIFGLVLGFLLGGLRKPLQMPLNDIYTNSITIVGVHELNNGTSVGSLFTLSVSIKDGNGRVAISIPPYENFDIQASMITARSAVERVMRYDLSNIDIAFTFDNSDAMYISGPSASAAMATLLVAAINDYENAELDEVRPDVVISATINEYGAIGQVGEIELKYQTARESGYSMFIIANSQHEQLTEYSDIVVKRVGTLQELVNTVLE